jgi:hypothetical protein
MKGGGLEWTGKWGDRMRVTRGRRGEGYRGRKGEEEGGGRFCYGKQGNQSGDLKTQESRKT